MGTVNKTLIQSQFHDMQTFPRGSSGPPGLGTDRIGINYYGVKGWTFNPARWTSDVSQPLNTVAAGFTLIATKLYVPYRCTITQVQFYLGTLMVSPISGRNWIGLYDVSGNKLIETADLSTEWSTGSGATVRTVNFTSSLRTEAGFFWAVVTYGTNSTAPGFLVNVPGHADLTNLNVTGLSARSITAGTTAGALPSSLGSPTTINAKLWLAVI